MADPYKRTQTNISKKEEEKKEETAPELENPYLRYNTQKPKERKKTIIKSIVNEVGSALNLIGDNVGDVIPKSKERKVQP